MAVATSPAPSATARRIRGASFSPSWAPALPRVFTSPRHSPRSPVIVSRPSKVVPTYSPIRLSAAGANTERRPGPGPDSAAVPVSVHELDTDKPPVSVHFLGKNINISPRLALLAVPFLWGSLPPVYKLRLKLPWALSAAAFNAARLLTSFFFLAPTAIKDVRSNAPDTKQLLRAGVELGFLTFLASTMQLIGVRYTSASRAAFLTQLQTVFVPILAAIAGDRSALSKHTLIASAVALAGVACLTLDSAAAPLTLAGDGTMLLVAVVAATLIIRNRDLAVKLRSGPLVAYKVFFQMVFAFIFMGASAAFFSFFGSAATGAAAASSGGIVAWFAACTPIMLIVNLMLVIWSGIFVNAGSTWLHVKGNTVVPATESAIIFSFTPLWASVFAVFLGERFGVKGIIGAILIVLSTILAARTPASKKQVDATPS